MNTLDRYGCPYKFAIDFLIRNGIKLEERENGIKYEDSNIARQVVRIAIEALEKQIAQKRVGEEGYPNCPKCGEGLIGEYCYECGQRTLKP